MGARRPYRIIMIPQKYFCFRGWQKRRGLESSNPVTLVLPIHAHRLFSCYLFIGVHGFLLRSPGYGIEKPDGHVSQVQICVQDDFRWQKPPSEFWTLQIQGRGHQKLTPQEPEGYKEGAPAAALT